MAKLQVEIEGKVTGLKSALSEANSAVTAFANQMASVNNQGEQIGRKTTASFDQVGKKLDETRRKALEVNNQFENIKPPVIAPAIGASNALPKLSNDLNKVQKSYSSANGVAIEFNRIIQDAPFGIIGVGNNITQLAQSFGTLKQQTGSAKEAFRQTISSMLTSGNLLSLGISAVVTGFTLWQMWSQKANKATKDLNDSTKTYIETLQGLERASADGQNNALKDLTNLKLLYDATQNLSLSNRDRKKAAQELIDQYPKQFSGLSTEAILAGKASKAYDNLTKSITATAMAAAYANKMTENAQKQLNNYLQILDKQNKYNKLALDIEKARKDNRSSTISAIGESARGFEIQGIENERKQLLKDINELGKQNNDITKENALLQNNYNSQIGQGADLSGNLDTSLDNNNDKLREQEDLQKRINSVMNDGLNYYDNKLADIRDKYTDLTKGMSGVALEQARINKLAEEYAVYIERLNDTYKEMQKSGVTISNPTASAPASLPGLDKALERSAARIRNANAKGLTKKGQSELDEDALNKRLSKVVEAGFRQGLGNLFDDIDDLGSNFYDVFSNVFNKLSGSVIKTFQNLIATELGNSFSKLFSGEDGKGFKFAGLSEGVSKGVVAGLGVAGGLVSSMTGKTNTTGQIAGGALTGAAAGTAILPGLGTLAGAVLGGVAGFFGSKAAKKQQQIQEQQLAEQRKQTALLTYQNALSYASNIIGQKTVDGIVTAVDRNATGQLIATIAGKDIKVILDRNGGAR